MSCCALQKANITLTGCLLQPNLVIVSLAAFVFELLAPSFVIVSSGKRLISFPCWNKSSVGRSNDAGSLLTPNSSAKSG